MYCVYYCNFVGPDREHCGENFATVWPPIKIKPTFLESQGRRFVSIGKPNNCEIFLAMFPNSSYNSSLYTLHSMTIYQSICCKLKMPLPLLFLRIHPKHYFRYFWRLFSSFNWQGIIFLSKVFLKRWKYMWVYFSDCLEILDYMSDRWLYASFVFSPLAFGNLDLSWPWRACINPNPDHKINPNDNSRWLEYLCQPYVLTWNNRWKNAWTISWKAHD